MSLIFIILAVYLMFGTALGRHNYAKAVAHNAQVDVSSMLAEKIKEQKSITHGTDCWRGSKHNSTEHNCDCRHKPKWMLLESDIQKLSAGVLPLPNPYLMVTLWPLLGYHAFLTSGKYTVRPTPELTEAWVARVEKELNIPPLPKV